MTYFPALLGEPVTEAHTRQCAETGHATHTVDGADSGEWAPMRSHGAVWVSIVRHVDGTEDVEILDRAPAESFTAQLRDAIGAGRVASFTIRAGNVNGGDSAIIVDSRRGCPVCGDVTTCRHDATPMTSLPIQEV